MRRRKEKKKVGEKPHQHLWVCEQSCRDVPCQPAEQTLGNKRSVSFHTQVLGWASSMWILSSLNCSCVMDRVLPHVCVSKHGVHSSVLTTHSPNPCTHIQASILHVCSWCRRTVYLTITLELLPTRQKKNHKQTLGSSMLYFLSLRDWNSPLLSLWSLLTLASQKFIFILIRFWGCSWFWATVRTLTLSYFWKSKKSRGTSVEAYF